MLTSTLRAVFFVPSAIADTVLPLLDGYVAVAKRVGWVPELDLLLRGSACSIPGGA